MVFERFSMVWLGVVGLAVCAVFNRSMAWAVPTCEATYNSAVKALNTKQYITAERQFEQAQKLCQKSKTAKMNVILFHQSYAACQNGKLLEAEILLKKVLAISTAEPKMKGDSYFNLGAIASQTGRSEEAAGYFVASVEAFKKANLASSPRAKEAEKNLAILKHHEVEQEKRLALRARQQESQDKRNAIIDRINTVTALMKVKNYSQAKVMLEALLPEAETVEKPLGSYIYATLGAVCLTERNYVQSIALLQTAYGMARETEEPDIGQIKAILKNLIHASQYSGRYQDAQQYTQELEAYATDDEPEPTVAENPLTQTADYTHLLGHPSMRWSDQTRTILVYLRSRPDLHDWHPEDNNLVVGALMEWQKALNNRIVFQLTDDPNVYDVSIDWQETPIVSKTVNDAGGITTTRIWDKYMAANDILLTLHDPYNVPWNPYAIHGIALHEVGHMLGLRGHSDSVHDIMYPSGRFHEFLQNPHLSQRDINTIQRLYQTHPEISNVDNLRLSQFKSYQRKKTAVRWLLPTLGSLFF